MRPRKVKFFFHTCACVTKPKSAEATIVDTDHQMLKFQPHYAVTIQWQTCQAFGIQHEANHALLPTSGLSASPCMASGVAFGQYDILIISGAVVVVTRANWRVKKNFVAHCSKHQACSWHIFSWGMLVLRRTLNMICISRGAAPLDIKVLSLPT